MLSQIMGAPVLQRFTKYTLILSSHLQIDLPDVYYYYVSKFRGLVNDSLNMQRRTTWGLVVGWLEEATE
jgi:hypothetical protein